jgi:hypothetical protein
MKRTMRSCLVAGAVTMVVGGIATTPAEAAPAGVLLVAASDRVVTDQGQQFLSQDIYVRRAGDRIMVSGSADGSADFYVDDLLQLEITHPDGSVVHRQIDDSAACTADTVLTTAPTNIAPLLQWGVNKVRLTFRDACGGNYGNSDIYLAGAKVDKPDVSLPAMDGGTRVHIHHLKAGQGIEECTTGYTVQTGDRLYMTTAKHCFTGDHPTGTNAWIADGMPVSVRTADRPGRGGPDKYTFAQQMSCVAGRAVCLLPPNRYAPSADMMAFAPDTATPTSQVQTGRGLLPVLGATTAAALSAIKPAPTVCHYGLGSLRDRGKAEQCGPLSTRKDQRLSWLNAFASGGDSGGPVYYYAPDGSGVYALGLAVLSGNFCDRWRRCHVETGYVPIQVVESGLAARLRIAA